MRVYIAGILDGNRAAFTAAAERIQERGHEPVNPHDVTPHEHDGPCPARGYVPGDSGHSSSCCFMRTDMAAMLTCDAVYLLRGWEHSRGARDEFNAACAAGLDVEFEAVDTSVSDIDLVQGEVALWVRRNFGDDPVSVKAMGLVEEVGEVARAIVKREQGIRGTHEEWTAEVRKECADVFVKLCDVAQSEGFSLAEAVSERWAKVRQRDWVADKQGHGIGGAA